MEIEKKYKIKELPNDLDQYHKKVIEQGYLCTKPVVRIRRSNEDYILTYKSKIGLDENIGKEARVCNEIEMPLTEESYQHLRTKTDGNLIEKERYIIPLPDGKKAELDIFHGTLEGLNFVEVEFTNEEEAKTFNAPDWFGEDVSFDNRYSNNYLATVENPELLIKELM
jgi:CYTH domain-containing protein